MEEGKAPGLSWKRVEDTLSVAPPFPRALQGSGGTRAGRWTNGRLVQAPRAVCAVSALDVTKTTRLSFDHGHHPDHAKTQRPPDRRGSGQDRDPGRPGAGSTPPEGRPTGGSRYPVPLWRVCDQAVL